MTSQPAVNRFPSGWWLPVIVAAGLWGGLVAVTCDAPIWSAAHRVLPWMIQPLYHDLHILRLGWLTVLQGGDPLADAGNPFNYPRFVLAAAYVGILHVPPGLLGSLLAACFLGAVAMTVHGDGIVPPAIAAVLIVAPPVLLMIERGNLDAIAFVLLGLAFALLRFRPVDSAHGAAAALCVLVAALLKLYPAAVLAIVALLSTGRCRRWFAGALVLWGGWALLNAPEIALVLQKTTRGLEPAYGVALAGSRYYLERIAPGLAPEQAHAWLARAMRISMAVYAGGLLAAAGFGWRRHRSEQRSEPTTALAVAFVSGGLIYAGTFLLGANWSYRLVFLLFCVPLLWHHAQIRASRRGAIALLVGIAIVVYAPFHLPLAWFFVVQIASWLTAWGLMAKSAAVVRLQVRRPAVS